MPPEYSQRVYVHLDRKDIGLFKFLLEAWDNLAYLTVIDKYKAVVQVVYGYGFEQEMRDFLDRAGREIFLQAVFSCSDKT